jgi:hypothetical protein
LQDELVKGFIVHGMTSDREMFTLSIVVQQLTQT